MDLKLAFKRRGIKMSTRKNRNPLNLSLPPTVREEFTSSGDESSTTNPLNESIELDERLQSLVLSQPQVERMNKWMTLKKQIGELCEESLDRVCELGHGNGGVVHKMRHKDTGLTMARKLVHLEVKPSVKTQILKELEVLHKCNSPYIIGFYGAFTDVNDISICMEYMDGLSLDKVMKKSGRIAEPRAGRIAVAVIKGLIYLKEEFHILHRDVKPSNILVNSQGEIKLCDFGVSTMLIDSMANSFVGTRSYMAPERLTGVRYSIQSDIWSFGLSMVELVIGRFPIPAPSRYEYARMFDIEPEEVHLQYPVDETAEDDGRPPRMMSIFDLLDYIVNNDPPLLPNKIFSEAFVEFVNKKCLVKEVRSRADLRVLMDTAFYKHYDVEDGEREFTAWIRSIIENYGQS
ncbi:hypothetical protein M3Y95_01209700 [Aphelenchoides besseyi]|nr:hypothetical protein M3Y95_01209700 [Aphelenchoides besseyi]